MTYRSGTIANTLPAANLIISAMEPDMLNVGYVKVGTNIVANQYTWNAYKSPGTNNSIGTDWFIYLGWDTASNANLLMTISEVFFSGNNTVAGYPPNTSSIIPLANGWANAQSSVLPNTTGSNVQYLATNALSALNSTNTSYFQSITIDRVIICTANVVSNPNAGCAFYGGMYDTFMANTLDPVPILIANLKSGLTQALPLAANNPGIGFVATREPNQLSSISYNFMGPCSYPLNYSVQTANTAEGYTGKYLVSRVLLYGRGQNQTIYIRGLLKDIWNSTLNSFVGDTIQFNYLGNTITATCTSNNLTSVQQYPYMAQV